MVFFFVRMNLSLRKLVMKDLRLIVPKKYSSELTFHLVFTSLSKSMNRTKPKSVCLGSLKVKLVWLDIV